MRQELEASLEEKNAQLELLRNQVEQLREELRNSSAEQSAVQQAAQAQAKTLESLIAQLETQKQETTQRLSSLPKTREPVMRAVKEQSEEAKQIEPRMYRDLELGRYFALLIGNQNYNALENLDTPLNDVARARQILEEKYGFTVITIEDGNNIELMEAINDLYALVGENDNLLIFYAGHGNRLTTGGTEIGYWLPANAVSTKLSCVTSPLFWSRSSCCSSCACARKKPWVRSRTVCNAK